MKTLVCFEAKMYLYRLAKISRECGELRQKLDRSDADLQKSQTSLRQEASRCRLILSEMVKLLDSIPQTRPTSPTRILPNESLSFELSRFQTRFNLLVSLSSSADTLAAKDARISELEAALADKENECLQSSKDFNTKLLDMRAKMDILNYDLEKN